MKKQKIKASIVTSFIEKRVHLKLYFGQLLLAVILLNMYSCTVKKDDILIIPPVTSPLSRDCIGYGVITASFAHISDEPLEEDFSNGYLRRGTLVQVLKRQSLNNNGSRKFVFWVYIQSGSQQGWLKEENLVIYDTENQAKTASESVNK